MSYKVLYRKYRPQSFNDIIDQKFITDTLKESITNNKISHAYIFSGPKGTGKTSTAKVFARAINCMNPIDGEPCGKCDACLNFDKSSDIIELDAASNNKVEDIREIINNVKLAPTDSKYKIYIIDEVHMLTQSAANAFLLTLEEPPSHAVFILATTNPESLPQTILSRCQQFAFSKITKKALVSRIKYVLDQENIVLSDEVINEIADLADGGLRDALSILDQLITLNKPIDVNLISEQFGIVSETVVKNLVDAIVNNDISSINNIFDSLNEYGYNEKTFINKFIATLTKRVCGLAYDKQSDITKFKNIVFEIIKVDNFKVNFNYYDVIKMIIITNISLDNQNKSNKSIISNKSMNECTKIESQKEVQNISQEINEETKNDDNLPKVNKNNDILKIRINNSFANADKKMKTELVNEKDELFEKIKNDNNLYSLMIDVEVGVVSPTNILFVCDSDASSELLNENSEKIAEILELNKKLVFVVDKEWKKLAENYAENYKNKVVYQYIEEPNISTPSSEIENIASDIFGNDNIIVEE